MRYKRECLAAASHSYPIISYGRVVKMKSLLFLAVLSSFVLFCSATCPVTQNATSGVDMNDGVGQGMLTYEEFFNKTTNITSQCGYSGCCPVIVRGGKKGSVIQPFTGYRGNVAIIVDWGGDDPCNRWRRRCTPADHGFIWYVDWGDGRSDHGYQRSLGPFQVAHQYPQYCYSYGITVYYCSEPGCPHRRCCSSLYRVIDVSYDPQNPYPEIEFKN